MPNPELVYGDRSRFSLELLNTYSFNELEMLVGVNSKVWKDNQPPPKEVEYRQSALKAFFEAVKIGHPSSQTSQKFEINKVVEKLCESESFFDSAWPSTKDSATSATPEFEVLKKEATTRFDEIKKKFEEDPSKVYRFDDAIPVWLSQVNVPSRGTQVVLDLALHVVVAQNFEQEEKLDEEDRSVDWLLERFIHRVKAINSYRIWALPDVKSFVAGKEYSYVPHNADYNYCNHQHRSVCTALLFGSEESGSVLWLTVDLYEDGLGTFAPDVFSLGWTQIALNLNPEGNTEEENEGRGILASFDEMWRISRLAELGFSGKWRITNRPLVTCEASRLEPSLSIPTCFDPVLTGRSAETAMLVGLLAASGLVYDRIPKEFPAQLEIRLKDRSQHQRVPLNPYFAATAKVDSAKVEDIRLWEISEVHKVNYKCSAASIYKPENRESVAPLIDTIIISQADHVEQSAIPSSFISTEQSKKQKRQRQTANVPPFRGVHFQPGRTVQDALNWMLSVNQWRRISNKADLHRWEKQWDVVRNELGQPIGLDEYGNHTVVDEKDGISTGSIEYMRNPFGGVKKPETEAPVEDNSTDDNAEVNPR